MPKRALRFNRLVAILSTGALSVIAVLLFVRGTARAEEIDFTLPNGLRVSCVGSAALAEAAQGKVGVGVFFDVGEVHDPIGRSGLAHLCEHLYVTAATERTPARTANEWLVSYGRQANAQTTFDATFVITIVAHDQLDAELADIAARLTDLRITDEDLARELPRLEAELANMFGGHPNLAAPNHAQAAIDPLPEGSRKGGRIEQLREVTVEEAAARLRAVYTLDRVRLVLAGAVDPASVRSRVERHFGAIEEREPTVLPRRETPPPRRGARIEVPLPPQLHDHPDPPRLIARVWAMPPIGTPESAACHAIGAKLLTAGAGAGGMMGSFLPKFAPIDDPRVIGATVLLQPGEEPTAALARLEAKIDAAMRPASTEEITATMRQLRVFFELDPPSPFTLGRNPYLAVLARGRRLQMGLDRAAWSERWAALTPEQITAVGTAHFSAENAATVLVGVPRSALELPPND